MHVRVRNVYAGGAHRWESGTSVTLVELDKKGRLLLPASLRRKLGARRYEVELVAGRIVLAPIQDLKALKGKYRSRIKAPWVKLEEKAEKLVRERKR
jgi:bifunctional DNA-binding transcriptional regulator/antitoxin component of YhaV-PrlF toxin-antitoxin module